MPLAAGQRWAAAEPINFDGIKACITGSAGHCLHHMHRFKGLPDHENQPARRKCSRNVEAGQFCQTGQLSCLHTLADVRNGISQSSHRDGLDFLRDKLFIKQAVLRNAAGRSSPEALSECSGRGLQQRQLPVKPGQHAFNTSTPNNSITHRCSAISINDQHRRTSPIASWKSSAARPVHRRSAHGQAGR